MERSKDHAVHQNDRAHTTEINANGDYVTMSSLHSKEKEKREGGESEKKRKTKDSLVAPSLRVSLAI